MVIVSIRVTVNTVSNCPCSLPLRALGLYCNIKLLRGHTNEQASSLCRAWNLLSLCGVCCSSYFDLRCRLSETGLLSWREVYQGRSFVPNANNRCKQKKKNEQKNTFVWASSRFSSPHRSSIHKLRLSTITEPLLRSIFYTHAFPPLSDFICCSMRCQFC